MPPEPIEFIILGSSDGPRLIVLKSMYNRCANRLNADIFSGWKKEHQDLLVQLKYLKEQIDQYE